jgi:hypothetical protein
MCPCTGHAVQASVSLWPVLSLGLTWLAYAWWRLRSLY